MTEERKPWYLHTLSRMDARARELCPNNALRGLGERIVAAELSGSECDTIDAELERMLRENGSQYDQMGLSFLKHFLIINKTNYPIYRFTTCWFCPRQ